jgi:hypothetical protein
MEKVISPDVKFKETDLSFNREEPEITDFVIVGATPKGRYFVPQSFSSYGAYVDACGGVSRFEYTGLTVKNTLSEADSVTVLPVAKTEDYDVPLLMKLSLTSGSETRAVAHLLLSYQGVFSGITSASISGQVNNFSLTFFSGSTALPQYALASASLYATDKQNFIGNITNPLSETNAFYTKYISDVTKLANNASGFGVGSVLLTSSAVALALEDTGVTFSGFKSGRTPWVLSQTINGSNLKLFRFHTLAQGDMANRTVKISIENQQLPSEISSIATDATFDVVVRSYNDVDQEIAVLESFTDVTLNFSSPRYIGRVIGDINIQYNSVNAQIEEDGIFPNASRYIRVEVGAVEDFPDTALPYGFERYDHAGVWTDDAVPAYTQVVATGSLSYSGVNFDSYSANRTFIDTLHKELPKTTAGGYNTGSVAERFVMGANVTDRPVADRKFSFGFFGATNGFDPANKRLVGLDITTSNCMGFDFTNSSSEGTVAYKRAFDILSDREFIDFKTLVVPGPNLEEHGAVMSLAISMCRSRGDVFMPCDAGSADATVGDLETVTSAYDSSYAAAYAPWYWVNDSELGYVISPQASLFPATLAYNDKVSRPWYAPFGYNRGKMERGLKAYRKFNLPLRDRLYAKRVNAVAKVVGESSAIVLGQRTLQLKSTALEFINVRRLLNEAKKTIGGFAKYYLGQPNNATTRAKLVEQIQNYLARVQQENGLEDFRVVFDERLNTPDVIDRGLVRGIIYLVPTRAIQGIQINFVITNTGVNFDDLL